jgi:uncharacterized integral membrane protein (TIGR00698 family)
MTTERSEQSAKLARPLFSLLAFWLLVAAALTPLLGVQVVSPPVALALGLVFALVAEHPYRAQSAKATKWLLQVSVVGLGFGLDIGSVIHAGLAGFWFTVATIVGTILVGLSVGRWMNIRPAASQLITVGTAICGGSAIAAVAPVIRADDADTSVALGTVFVLNAAALFIFPFVGAALQLTQEQFGLWAAIAIHDTSSVVGAATRYGAESLATATTVKLSRALWIIPIAFGFAWAQSRGRSGRNGHNDNSSSALNASIDEPSSRPVKIAIPYFIFIFVLASLARTFVPPVATLAPHVVAAAKVGLTLTLLLIGMGLSRATLRKVGVKPLLQGVILWVLISCVALWVVRIV